MSRAYRVHHITTKPVAIPPPVRTLDARWPRPPRRSGPWPLILVIVALVAALAVGGVLTFRSRDSTEYAGSFVGAAVTAPTGPRLLVPPEIAPTEPGFVSELRGMTEGATALTVNGEPVPLDAGGAFSMYLLPEWTEARLVASDDAGNQAEAVVSITSTPAPIEHPPTTAVHIAAPDWDNPAVHQQIVDLIAAGRINAVQLDIKNESGEVAYDTNVELANISGAAQGYYDAREAIDELHGLGVRVIGRIVNFLDGTLASWAAENGREDMIVLSSGGSPLANSYGTAAFTNFANPEVRQYQIDLAVEAASLGFDEILYDYVRRPEGEITEMNFPGLQVPPEVSVARFVADTRAALAGTDTLLGVSVFGISASRPEPTAQDVRLLAPNVDYVAPMVYPALWGPGEYGVADPVRQPADIVTASLLDFQRVMAGSGAAIVPWLQDFNSGPVTYGPAEIKAQIDAAYGMGASGFLMWNANSVYHPEGLPVRTRQD